MKYANTFHSCKKNNLKGREFLYLKSIKKIKDQFVHLFIKGYIICFIDSDVIIYDKKNWHQIFTLK